MKRGIGITVLVGALVAAFALGRAEAQDGGGGDAMQEAMKKAWMEIGTPGPEHAELKKMVGDWTVDVVSYHNPEKPAKSKGKCTFKMALDGRYLEQHFSGTMDGTPFTGIGYTAFNKATGKYEATWMDSMSTGIMHLTGEMEDGVCTYNGHFFGPGGAKIKARYEEEKPDADTMTFVMYMDAGMGEMKAMEMTYKRAKEE